jgi:organic hydroperoxide reductase OsmC/OhrA
MNSKEKKIPFEVQLNWIAEKKGLLSAPDAEGTMQVATPPAFGGTGNPWTPEHLFLSAINSCFMTTFLAFADKFKFPISRLECPVVGQVSFEEGRYRFSAIDLYPKIYIADEAHREKVMLALEKTHKYCIITHSVSTPVQYHNEVILEDNRTYPGLN